ncbi:MAG TPA: mycothiol system anti-sigma-R factor [Propionibacteriaceae bacterium]|jgi:anti-sigma factor (TIGR02949 family)|nr:mycothiol system anti-sigma-R factor [Propionibacteriaceae bacterium]
MNVDRPGDASFDDCEHVLERVYEFLDNELDAATSDAIRQHLAMCEPCIDRFDAEQAVKALVHRSCGGEAAPSHLRAKIVTQLTVIRKKQ